MKIKQVALVRNNYRPVSFLTSDLFFLRETQAKLSNSALSFQESHGIHVCLLAILKTLKKLNYYHYHY